MGFMDNIEGQALNRVLGGSSSPIAAALLQVVQSQPGGLQGVVERFHQNGLGGLVSSWISTGQNQSISPDQVQQGLGNDTVQQVAEKAGVSPEEAKSSLSQLLPEVVDKLTPNGQVPDHGSLMQMGESLLNSFRRSA